MTYGIKNIEQLWNTAYNINLHKKKSRKAILDNK